MLTKFQTLLSVIRQHATAIALAFHISGFIAIAFFKSTLFVSLTPLNLVVSFLLLAVSYRWRMLPFVVFVLVASAVGFFAEYLGVNHQLLFGDYKYGAVLGPGWRGVPYIMALQWVVTVYCAACVVHSMYQHLLERVAPLKSRPAFITLISVSIDGALLATLFDWVLEPVAIALGFWEWTEATVPIFNYISWFGVSLLLLIFLHLIGCNTRNRFAIHLFMMQFMFFLLLRFFIQP